MADAKRPAAGFPRCSFECKSPCRTSMAPRFVFPKRHALAMWFVGDYILLELDFREVIYR